MKLKIMIMGVMLACAGSAMASSVKWGITVGDVLNTTDFGLGSSLYLVWDNNAGGFAYNGVLASQESFTMSKVLDTQVGAGSLVAGYYYNAVGQAITPTTLGVTAGNKPFYLVAISSDGKTIAYTAAQNVNVQPSALSVVFGYNAADFTTVHAIPEPASMALLALGVGVIALRRRFRKSA